MNRPRVRRPFAHFFSTRSTLSSKISSGEFEGHVIEIQKTAEDRGLIGNAVKVRVAVNKDQLPELRSGAGASARIHCGRHAIGYVWFRELIETVQRNFVL